jgi:predicted acetyltransferase
MIDAPSDPTTSWHIRSPEPDELKAFMAPLPAAFGVGMPDEELEDWARLIEPERWIGAMATPASSEVVGSAAAYTFRLTVPGGEVTAAGVTAVAVRPDHRRRGILTALMRTMLDDVRRRGEPVAVLWASEGAIYQRFGYGSATLEGAFEVDSRHTAFARPWSPEGRVRIVTEDEAVTVIPPIYEAMRRVTPGALSRSEAWWRTGPLSDPVYRRDSGLKFRVVYEADGSPEGYALYRVKDQWDPRGPRSVLEVSEAVTVTPRALRDLWRFLFEVDLVRTVKASRVPLPFPLQLLLAEPRGLGLLARDGLWLRLVDLGAALSARSYATRDALVLEVTDEACPWNEGRWRIDTTEDREAVARVDRADAAPDLVLDTADLAALYLGGVRASDLAQAGRVSERSPGALQRADAFFAADRSPWCVSMF